MGFFDKFYKSKKTKEYYRNAKLFEEKDFNLTEISQYVKCKKIEKENKRFKNALTKIKNKKTSCLAGDPSKWCAVIAEKALNNE